MASKALDMHRAQREETDKAIEQLKRSGSADGIKSAQVATGLLAAESNRELSAALLAATEILDSSIQHLNVQIEVFTEKADAGTNRLATWTIVLAICTFLLVVATAALVYATLTLEPPQIINVPRP